MKTKIKRHSHAVLSVVLAVCMVLSCMTVGLIATDAAKVNDQGAVGASTDTQPATDEGAALDNDETAGLSESGEGALGANLDEDSPLGNADVYCVKGTFNNWSETHKFDANTKKVSITLAAKTKYEFKIFSSYNGGSRWYGSSRNYIASDGGNYFNINNDNNATLTTTIAGTYTFELKREENNGDGAVDIAITYPTAQPTTYTVSKAAATNGSFSVSPSTAKAGDTITVITNPNRGYKLKSITATGVSTVNIDGYTGTFAMPAQNTTVTVTFEAATSYNVTAQVTDGSGTVTLSLSTGATTHEAKTTSGTTQLTMTAYDGETLKVTATPASGYQLGTLTRGGTSVSSGDIWTVSGDTAVAATFTKRSTLDNEYNATAGTTITDNSNLYSKIKATFFDYYTDNEVNGSWYSSINAEKDAWIGGMSNIDRNPYETLNNALSKYASDNSVARPMYFGSFYWNNAYHDPGYTKSAQTTYNGHKINDSNQLTGGNTAVLPGLAGKTINDGSIYYYGDGTNENGAENPLFNKEWLASREGSTSENITVYFTRPNDWNSNNKVNIYYWNNGAKWPGTEMTYDGNNSFGQRVYKATIPANTEGIIFNDGSNQTVDITSNIKDGSQWYTDGKDGDKYKVKYVDGSGSDPVYTGALASIVNSPFPVRKTKKSGIDYYEFDSTGATDNVYFDNLTGGSPVIQYGAGTTYGQKNAYNPGTGNAYGFYPFDRYDVSKRTDVTWNTKEYGKDLAFGMKLDINFTVGAGGKINNVAQKFDFSGDDDLWVYIDGKLVLDMGGDHSKATGSIDFSTKKVSVTKTDTTLSNTRNADFTWFDNNDTSKVHTMTLYYMERGMHESNLKFGFSFNPQDDAYDVEKKLNTASLNEGLKSQFTDTFTFTNTSEDGKGGNASYTLYNSADNTTAGTGTTNEGKAFEMVDGGKYAQFKKVFTKQKTLQTRETLSNVYKYDTSYTVVDVQNNNSVIKAGTGLDTGTFNFFTNLENADRDLNITHLRTIFTNTLKTESFMITKAIKDFDDSDTQFPFVVNIKMSFNNHEFNAAGLKYKSSLDNYTTEHSLVASSITNGGLGYIKEGEYILIEGIPVGAKVTVREPVYGDKNTPAADGNANCYKFVSIASSNEKNNPQPTVADVTIQLVESDIITITNELKNYRMDYQLPTRLYGEKIYKLTGLITPAMVADGYVVIDNTQHTAYLTTKFVSDHIPYETIFMKNISWKSANANHQLSMNGFDDYVKLVAETPTDKTLTVQVDTDGDGRYETEVTGLSCGQEIKYNGEYITGTKSGATPSYWKIYDTDTQKLVTICYSRDLMYVAYDNYSIKAVYETGTGYDYYDKQTTARVNNLGVTRSHWNDTTTGVADSNEYYDMDGTEMVKKTYTYNAADTEYDRLYLDMEFAYEANGKMINTYSSSEVNVGYEIVILNDDGTIKKTYQNIIFENTKLNNKNRIHAYYGFKNSENNRAQKLGVRAFVQNGSTASKVYSDIMQFSLDEVGSKGLSAKYDTP